MKFFLFFSILISNLCWSQNFSGSDAAYFDDAFSIEIYKAQKAQISEINEQERLRALAAQTEAAICYDCIQPSHSSQQNWMGSLLPLLGSVSKINFSSQGNSELGTSSVFQGLPTEVLAKDDTNFEAPADDSMKEAIKHMLDYVKKNPSCAAPNKYALVNNISGKGKMGQTAIIDLTQGGKIVDYFATGMGTGGIGNVKGSLASPPGFFKLGNSTLLNKQRAVPGKWRSCGSGKDEFNYLLVEGQGCKASSLLPGENCNNTNAREREILVHSWYQGHATWGCTGFSLNKFCNWGPKLKNACMYNYTGNAKINAGK